ncbi:MAG TPA: kelch repeat-containing protein [Candidatus Dormibacteraeota bacterium]|nr:kelch repeat-containing protein [Candidatus Dormibacteraeota bacterium]
MRIRRFVRRAWLLPALMVAAFLGTTSVAHAQGTWTNAAPFPHPIGELYGTAIGDTMYVMGGYLNGRPLGLVYAYDGATNAWTQKKPMALPAHHVMMTAYQGKIYVFGGFVHPHGTPEIYWKPINNSWVYDPASDSWKALAPLPTPRGAGQAVAVGGKIYVIGGAASGVPNDPTATLIAGGPERVVGTCEAYDVAANTWSTCATKPTPVNHFLAAAVDGKIYAIDGRIGAVFVGLSSITDRVEEYDPATNRWLDKGRSPLPRGDVCGAAHDGKIYVSCGEYASAAGKMAYWAFESYDPATNSWTELAHMPVARHGCAAAFVGGALHIVGGSFQSDGMPGISSWTGVDEAYAVGP